MSRELLKQALDAYICTLPPAAQVNIRESMQRGESHTADAVEYGWNAALESMKTELAVLKNQEPVAWLHTLRSNGLKEVDMYQTKNALWHSEPLGYLDCELVATKEKTE